MSKYAELRKQVEELQSECNQWQKKLTEDAWPEISRLRIEVEKRKQAFDDMFEDCIKANAKLREENERLTEALSMATGEPGPWLRRLIAENKRLNEELAEWKAANLVVVELRETIESHMDMARSEWVCKAALERILHAAEGTQGARKLYEDIAREALARM